jgi:hypothetical protein
MYMYFEADSETKGLCMCIFAEPLNKFTNFHYIDKEGHAIQGSLCCVLNIHVTD